MTRETNPIHSVILTIQCPDQPGLMAAITATVHHLGGNILESEQYTDLDAQRFFLRLHATFHDTPQPHEALKIALHPLAHRYFMNLEIYDATAIPRVGILVSKHDHCLADLLQRHHRQELRMEIPIILGNHPTCAPWAERFGNIPFQACPINADTKRTQERLLLGFLKDAKVELIILARYMQILSTDFLIHAACPVINIHHSSLPAFIGAKPYEQAHHRGVKLIGATAHYATRDLDQGPIIAQATTTVTHRDTIADMTRLGRDLEQQVLAKAVRLHLEHRIIVAQHKTIIFD